MRHEKFFYAFAASVFGHLCILSLIEFNKLNQDPDAWTNIHVLVASCIAIYGGFAVCAVYWLFTKTK